MKFYIFKIILNIKLYFNIIILLHILNYLYLHLHLLKNFKINILVTKFNKYYGHKGIFVSLIKNLKISIIIFLNFEGVTIFFSLISYTLKLYLSFKQNTCS